MQKRPILHLFAFVITLPFTCRTMDATWWQAAQSRPSTVRQEARTAAAKGDIEEAVQKFRRAIAENPRDAESDLEFAHFLANVGKYPEAIGMYGECLRLIPNKEAAELGLAEAYRHVHNPDEARLVLKSARAHHPKSVAVLKALGSLELEAESYDTAIEALRAAAVLAPSDEALQNLLGSAYLGKGDKEAALAHLQKALAGNPADTLALFLRAQIYADRNESEKALGDAEEVVVAQPDNPQGKRLLAKLLIRLKQCERAATLLRPTENPPSLDSEGLFLLGNAYDCAGKAELAKSAREEFAVASDRDRQRAENEVQSKHMYEQANELARQNKFPEALDLLQRALDKDPRNGFAYSQQAKIFFSMHETDKAKEAIAHALAIQPYQPDFLYVEGVIAESESKDEEALAAFERVTQINPKEADAYFEMGRIFARRKDHARALAAFRKAVQLEPNDPDYKQALAEASSRPR
jgi:superkiller protein 3